uniref:Tyrosine-protein phosphatase domain-containing protein n=1 Tax=Steinernema glaseri TaxID=37863 RepID=A0A1I7ZVW0_9BILA
MSTTNAAEAVVITAQSGESSSDRDRTSPASEGPWSAAPSKFQVAQGQFLHDCNGRDETPLETFAGCLCAMNVYRVFFDYTTVIAQDQKEAANTFEAHPNENRYRDIRCLDKTRVKIQDGPHDYIHANYVDGYREHKKFILTQAPLEQTAEQFWSMVWQEKAVIIVSLTPLDNVNCYRYMSTQSGAKMTIDGKNKYNITHMGTTHVRDTYDATHLLVSKNNEPARKILHLCFYTWPDKGTPLRPTELLYFVADINHNRKLLIDDAIKAGWLPNSPDTKAPIVIHCLAGVGRSGALVSIDICSHKLDHTYSQGKPISPSSTSSCT